MGPAEVFERELEQAVAHLRCALVEDVVSSAAGLGYKGGIRTRWRELVQQLSHAYTVSHPNSAAVPERAWLEGLLRPRSGGQ